MYIEKKEYEKIKEYLKIAKQFSLLKSKEKYLLSRPKYPEEAYLFFDTESMVFYSPKYDNENKYNTYFNDFIKNGWKKLNNSYELNFQKFSGKNAIIGLDCSTKPNYIIFYTLYKFSVNDNPISDNWRSHDISEEWKQSLFYMIPNQILNFLEENDFSFYTPYEFEIMISFLFPEENNFSQNSLTITSNNKKIQLKKITPHKPKENNPTELKKHQIFIEYIANLVAEIDQNHIKSSNQLYHKLSTLKSKNNTLQEIQNYLLAKFDVSFENLKEELIGFKLESVEYLEKLDKQSSIFELHKLSQQKIDFTFLYEVIAERYNKHLEQIHSFETNEEFLTQLYQRVEKLFKENNHFVHGKKNQLLHILEDNCIEEEIDNIYAEWANEVEKLSLAHLTLIKAYFHHQVSQTLLLNALDILFVIQEKLEEFFETTRSGIFIKYQNNTKKDLLQRIDAQSRIFDIYRSVQPKFVGIIKEEKNLSYQKTLSQNVNQLIDFHLYEEKGFEMISEEFMKLTKQNLEIYLSDTEQYGKELEKRDMEIGKLFFKMKKSLEKEEK